LRAQLPIVELHSIFPPVAKAGETLTVEVNGVNLDALESLEATLPGWKAERQWRAETRFRKHRAPEGNRFRVSIPETAEPGICEVRATGFYGRSNTRFFRILPRDTEVLTGEGAHDPGGAPGLSIGGHARGRFDEGKVDWYRIEAKKGERFFAFCEAEGIDSAGDAELVLADSSGTILETSRDYRLRDPLLDFQPEDDGAVFLGVHDYAYRGGGHYHLRVYRGPHIDAVFPPAGPMGNLNGHLVFGRDLEVMRKPNQEKEAVGFLGHLFPEPMLAGTHEWEGKSIEALPTMLLIEGPPRFVPLADDPVLGFAPVFAHRIMNSVPVRIGMTSYEVEVRQPSAPVTRLEPPAVAASWFDRQDREHRYRFPARKGAPLEVAVMGDALTGRVDPYVVVDQVVTEKEGAESLKKVAEEDDHSPGSRTAFPNVGRDPRLTFSPPDDGHYQITVVDQYGGTGFTSMYTLSVKPAVPGFRLHAEAGMNHAPDRRVRPASFVLRRGGSYAVRLVVDRTGGWQGELTVTATDLPEGVTMAPVVVPVGQDVAYAVLRASRDAAVRATAMKWEGRGRHGEKDIVAPVHFADVVWPVADYNKERVRTRMTEESTVSVIAETSPAAIESGDGKNPLTVKIGETLDLPFRTRSGEQLKGKLTVDLFGVRGLRKSPTAAVDGGEKEGKIQLSFAPRNDFRPQPGRYAFVLRAVGTWGGYKPHEAGIARVDEDLAQLEKALEAVPAEDETLREKATAVRKELETERKQAVERAKARDVVFAVYSDPVVVDVLPAPE